MTGSLYNWGLYFIFPQQVTRVNWSLRNWFSQVSFRDNPYTVTPIENSSPSNTHGSEKKNLTNQPNKKKTSNSDDDHTQLKKKTQPGSK